VTRLWRTLLPALLPVLTGALAIVAAMFPVVATAETPDAALAKLIEDARAEASVPGACAQPNLDRLVRIFCENRIRPGVREYYPLFGTREGETRGGYDIDVARALAKHLGVEPAFVRVNAATRIPLLAEDRIDVILATMGHNTQRDGQARFIRPHYYQSETTIVGPRALDVKDWPDIAGRTVCVTIGNGSNAQIVSHNARLMLFDEAGVLPGQLKDETCTLAAQDDTFFDYYFIEPAFAARFDKKFGFAQVPWGMAVTRAASAERLARALDLMSQIFHRDGVFLGIARANRVGTGFLERQQAVWKQPQCNTDTGSTNPACVLPALNADLQPTPFVGRVVAFEKWFKAQTGVELSLPMLKTMPAWSLFKDGIVNSLILVAGALAATLLFALVLGAVQSSRTILLRWPARAMTITLQSSPVVLTLVIAAAVAHALFPYSSAVAIGAAIVALGLMNGANAGQAIAEAMHTLRAERGSVQGAGGIPTRELFGRAVGRSATQIVSFLINAAKGTPIASFIGAPELLSALTDITSFASGRATTYSLLLVFYVVVVVIVVWFCGKLRTWLEHRQAAA
jgi:polar amino acid transport system substrate-binding protein